MGRMGALEALGKGLASSVCYLASGIHTQFLNTRHKLGKALVAQTVCLLHSTSPVLVGGPLLRPEHLEGAI